MAPPAWEMRPIFRPYRSVNQTYPSGLAVTRSGLLPAVGVAYSVSTPVGLRRATLLSPFSVNQILPSRAVVMPAGAELAAGRAGNSVTVDGRQRSSSDSSDSRVRGFRRRAGCLPPFTPRPR